MASVDYPHNSCRMVSVVLHLPRMQQAENDASTHWCRLYALHMTVLSHEAV
jgi:hypothetical protein